jgi:DNA-binding Lrp family transcriptional regulator
VTRKLDECDLAILAALGGAVAEADDLAARLDATPDDVARRLEELADNALVRPTADGGYGITGNGERVLAATTLGRLDDRIDTPADVEAALDELALPPDREDAVRRAVAYLTYWGSATAAELGDAVFDERPAGFHDRRSWWTELVRDALDALPDVRSPADDEGDGSERAGGTLQEWQYAGPATVDEGDLDGREILRMGGAHPGDARHAIESLGLPDAERDAARATFAALFARGTATEEVIGEAVYEEYPAGYSSSEDWWNGFLRDALAAVPAVEREDDEWRYVDG